MPLLFDGTKAIDYEGEPIAIPGKNWAGRFYQNPQWSAWSWRPPALFWSHAVANERISPERFVALSATNAAKIFGLYPKKGVLQVGSDADIAIWDPNLEVDYGVKTAKHRTDYNLYEGFQLKGYPVIVMQRGTILVDRGEWFGKAGQGRFINRLSGEVL